MPVEVLPINPGSDGNHRKWPKHSYIRNDAWFLEHIATDKWIKDLGNQRPGVTYRLDQLPQGYAGYEKTRPGSTHTDRYIYGHPNGQFRSLNEFYPHFKHLMDHGEAKGCTCKLCTNTPSRKPKQETQAPQAPQTPASRFGEAPKPAKPQPQAIDVDFEGVPDVYEELIEKLKAVGPGGSLDEPIEEPLSPDWRTGQSEMLLTEWRSLPRYAPRVGDIVLFVRKMPDKVVIAWHRQAECFQYFADGKWLEQPKWEAGVVTQMPKEPIMDHDLIDDSDKQLAVTDSGYRVEPLSQPGVDKKPYTSQYTYVPLHRIRPFSLWNECHTGMEKKQWHPSIKHALTLASSFCVIGRFRFKGTWPHATVFCRGVYIGSELIVVGDTVRLIPREEDASTVTDLLHVTAIRLRFVNLGLDETHIIGPSLPYQTCLHVSGRAFTMDPTRSFDGIGKVPVHPKDLPAGLDGDWYHYDDPQDSSKLELPYTRVLGRCYENAATKAWSRLQSPEEEVSVSNVTSRNFDTTYGLEGVVGARKYSLSQDARIEVQDGKSWFWADTRIEQLDLRDVNNRAVGEKDTLRTGKQMAKWRASAKQMTAKSGVQSVKTHSADGQTDASVRGGAMETEGAIDQPSINMRTHEHELDQDGDAADAADGMDGMDLEEQEADSSEREDAMEVDKEDGPARFRWPGAKALQGASTFKPINIDSDDSDDDNNQRAEQLAKFTRQ